MSSFLDILDAAEGNKNLQQVDEKENGQEVHDHWVLLQMVEVFVQADVVKANHNEGVDRADGVVRLPLFPVAVVGTDQPKRLNELDVVETAHKPILTVADTTAKPENAIASEPELDCVS